MILLLASGNPGKAREVGAALAGLPVRVVTPKEAGISLEVEETGSTYAENALLKAEAACRAGGLPALADDSGIEVDALPGELGVRSARFGGEGLDDAGRNRLLLERLAGVEEARRGARFVCVLAFVRPGGRFGFFEGELSGRVLAEPRGEGGFGYDPLLYLPSLGRTVAELDLETKNRISHRGRALAAFRGWLARELAENPYRPMRGRRRTG
ncbi:MAG: RdgB/HAM1 family non-canonical purine NTP pyrophosphatase [Candidatus Tectomicrobia bacterium]|uniref:dITP/XTP pyrophosphatase n=1 Tax=Tectimicrobiota bacterium TaxID=2528274 RepID=A0A932HY36_UNCTE|nr:RdgB/HAM1 family non-canonical purine NTP pyrophosphatase [Candidatus Tectomicrobia bacterium]